MGVGKYSLRLRRARAGSGVSESVKRLEPRSSQALGHPGATGSHGKGERSSGLDLAGRGRELGGGGGKEKKGKKKHIVHICSFLGLSRIYIQY